MKLDVVHTHNPIPLLYAAPIARFLGIRRPVHTKHGANVYSRASLAVARAATRTLSAFVAVSAETAEIAKTRERVPERLLHVIQNGIPLGRFRHDAQARARVRSELGIPEDAVVVGTVGRLAEEKDHPLLVRAMTPRLGPGVRLVIVGDGPRRQETERSDSIGGRRLCHAHRRATRRASAPFGIRRLRDELAHGGVASCRSRGDGRNAPGCRHRRRRASRHRRPGSRIGCAARQCPRPGPGPGRVDQRRARRVSMGEAALQFARRSFSIERMTRDYEALYA